MNKFIEVGLVLKPHGINGAIKIKNLSFGHFNFEVGEVVVIDDIERKIIDVSGTKDDVILTLENLSLTEANALKNKSIFALREKVNNNGDFFWADLIGKKIMANSKELGQVADIQNFGSADVIFVEGERNFSFANTGGIIISLNDEDNLVYVNEKKLKEVICYED